MNQTITKPGYAGSQTMSGARTRILAAALISFILSVSTWFFFDKDAGLFVGLWVPSILSLGTFLETTSKGGHQ